MTPDDRVRKLYTDRAAIYDRLFVDFLGWGKELRNFFRKTDTLRPNSKILDAGCGTGVITKVLYELSHEAGYEGMVFHAFDLTQAMLEVFQRWVADQQANNVELRQADVLAYESLPDDWIGYDLIVSSTMLEYLPTDQVVDALVNLRRRLRSGGRLLVFVTRRNMITRWLAQRWWGTRVFEEGEIRSLLQEAGFSQITFQSLSPGWSNSIMVIEASP